MNDPRDYADDGSGAGLPQDPTAGLDRTVTIAAPSMGQIYQPPAPIQYSAQVAGIPAYTYQTGPVMGGGYGNDQTFLTQQRAAYGNSPMLGLMGGGMRGAYTVGSGAASGLGNMFSAIGANIAPISYTPPAHVLTDFSGRYMQQTNIMADLKNMIGFGSMMRSAHVEDMRYNAASDLGEKIGLAGAGLTVGAGTIASSFIGGSIGTAALGTLGGIAAGIAAPIAFSALAGDRIERGVSDRREIMNFLEHTSDRYIGAGSADVDRRRGAGFSSGARREVTEYLRELDVKDPMLDTSELSRILKESTGQGLFTGTKDVSDFKKRFKDIVDNVKIVATTLHQTLEEGVKTVHDLRAAGIAPSQVASTMLKAEAAAMASGRSAGEIVNLGLQGAELFRGTGVSMQIGYESNVMNIASIRAARDAKMLSEEAVAQAGGEEALAQRMTASSLGFTQSQTGRGMMGMMFNPALIGSGFDPGVFSQMVKNGGGDLNSNVMRAAMNLANPGSAVKFQANQEALASDIGKQFGGRGLELFTDNAIMMQATHLSRMTGASVEDSFKVIAKTQANMSETEAVTRLATIKNAPQAFETAQAATQRAWEKTKEDQASQNFFMNRIGARIEAVATTAADVVARPLADTVEHVREGLVRASDYVVGTQRVNLAGTGYDQFVDSRDRGSAVVGKARKLGRMDRTLEVDADGRVTQRVIDIDRGGQLGLNAGEALAEKLRTGSMGSFKLAADTVGDVILEKENGIFAGSMGESRFLGETAGSRVTLKGLERLEGQARIATTTLGEAQELDSKGKLKAERDAVHAAYLSKLGSQDLVQARTGTDVVAALFGKGKTAADLTKSQYAAALLELQNSPRLQKLFDTDRSAGEAVLNALNAVSVSRESGDLAQADAARHRVNELLSPSSVGSRVGSFFTGSDEREGLTPAAMARLARINALAQDRGTSPEAMAAAEKSFSEELGKIGGDRGDKLRDRLPEILDRAKSGDPSLTQAFKEFTSNFVKISDEQQRRGQQLLGRALEADIFGGDADKLGEKEKRRLVELVDRVGSEGAGAVRDIGKNKEDLALLEQTSVGKTLSTEAQIIGRIEGVAQKGSGRDGLVNELRGLMPQERLEKVVEAFSNRQSSSDAIAEVHAQTMDQVAGKTNMASAGSVSGATGGPGGTADANATTQLNINIQTLTALTALASRLKQ